MSAQMAGLLAALACAAVNGAQLGAALRGWGQSTIRGQAGPRAALAFGLCALNVVAMAMALGFLAGAASAPTDWLKGVGIGFGLAPQWIFAAAIKHASPFLQGEQKMAWPAGIRRWAQGERSASGERAGE